MRTRLQREIDKLKSRVISLATLVEERFKMAVKAVECKDVDLAMTVIQGDSEVDRFEVDVEEDGLKILALHQPVADHLRYIIAVIKLNNDLERIGDLAVNIAERVVAIDGHESVAIPFDYYSMCQKVQEMLKKSLDALVNKDLALAYEVCAADDDVDAIKKAAQNQFVEEVRKNPDKLETLMHLFLTSRHLERIADHTTNIAEDVIYMITGEIHRHRGHPAPYDGI
jgi:phosphate transport system protein